MKILICLLAISLWNTAVRAQYRTYDGSQNNVNMPLWGAAGIDLVRYAGTNSYKDGISQMIDTLPSPRLISNVVFGNSSTDTPRSTMGYTDFLTYWGQFIDHDMTYTVPGTTESAPIPVPICDPYFDPACTGNKTIGFRRSAYNPTSGATNPRAQINNVTAFLDASQVYGSDDARAAALRTFSGGKLLTSNNGLLPPKNVYGFYMENNAHVVPDTELFFFGDVRGNENPALAALQTLFIREHNRLATQFATAHPDWTDEQLYQTARKWVGAYIQRISANEYFPLILGEALPFYSGYDYTVDPSVFTEFSTGAFRYGHSEVNAEIWRLDNNGPIAAGNISLRNGFYNPSTLDQGIDSILLGIATQRQSEVDTHFVDDIRNFLFGQPGSGGFDLIAINTNRGRDHGMPLFNEIREMFGLTRYTSFDQVTSDASVAAALAQVYGDINLCELYVCGLAEDHAENANVGPTFKAVIKTHYQRVRDGDRFWYQNPGVFTADELAQIEATYLSDIILRNTDLTSIQCFVMSVPDQCISHKQPTSTTGGYTPVPGYDFVVSIADKTTHPWVGQGSEVGYVVNGVQGMELTLVRGVTYKFFVDVSCSHMMYISTSNMGWGAGLYLDGVTGNGACSSATLTFTPSAQAPSLLYYQCQYHSYMGYKINIVDSLNGTTGSATTGSPVATTGAITTGAMEATTGTTGVESSTTAEAMTTGSSTTSTSTTGIPDIPNTGSTTGIPTLPKTCPNCTNDVCAFGVCNATTGACYASPFVNGTPCQVRNMTTLSCYSGYCFRGECVKKQDGEFSCSTTGVTSTTSSERNSGKLFEPSLVLAVLLSYFVMN